jgi:glucosyl-3-phosphoglycerate synthase
MLDTLEHTDFEASRLAAAKTFTVSVVVPTRNTAGTIAATIGQIAGLAELGLVDEILVVDADSKDGTAQVAHAAGADVVDENDLHPELGPTRGKGDAMWRSLSQVTGDVVVFVDGDIADFGGHFITGLLGPLITDPSKSFVKGTYRRPFRQLDVEQPSGGGRVTELTAKPLLGLTVPELSGFDQPLAGEVAGRRELFESVPFFTGYGVEIAMLVDVWAMVGIKGMAQVNLGTKRNSHQSLAALNRMATEVAEALSATLQRLGLPETGTLLPAPGVEPSLLVRGPHRSTSSADPAAPPAAPVTAPGDK